MLVEDHDGLRAVLASELGIAGFEVDAFPDGTSALAAIPVSLPDVALLDVSLGDGPDGIAVAEALRLARADVGIVFMSSGGNPLLDDRTAGAFPGARFLAKDAMQGIEEVVSLLAEASAPPAP